MPPHPLPPAAAAASSLILFLILAAPCVSASWCVCKDGISDAMMQKTIDYACGAGADCNAIRSSGACYNPNTLKSHCSYAVNSYYQRKASSGATCDFSGTANIVSSDPSVSSGCKFPGSSSAAGTTTTPITNTPPSTRTPTTPTTTVPYSTTPTNNGFGGIGTGQGPSGSNTDFSRASSILLNTVLFSSSLASVLGLVVMLQWG